MLYSRGLANRQGNRAVREPELKMRERSKASADRDEDSLGQGGKRDHQLILLDVRYTLAPLWSLYTGGGTATRDKQGAQP